MLGLWPIHDWANRVRRADDVREWPLNHYAHVIKLIHVRLLQCVKIGSFVVCALGCFQKFVIQQFGFWTMARLFGCVLAWLFQFWLFRCQSLFLTL